MDRIRRRTLVLAWLADLLIVAAVSLPFSLPALFEQSALAHRFLEQVDVWQFDSMPATHDSLRAWARRTDLRAFRIDPLAPRQIVLRYLRDRTRPLAAPDWPQLRYANPRRLSADSLPVRAVDWPRSALSWSGLFAATVLGFAVLTVRVRRALRPRGPWTRPSPRSWLLALLLFLATVLLAALISRGRLFDALTSIQTVLPELSGWALFMACLSVTVAGPALEETLYRGGLFLRFEQQGYAVSGALLSAFAFAAAHGAPALIPNYFLKGLLLAWLTRRARSLWPAFALHAGWNLFSLVLALRP